MAYLPCYRNIMGLFQFIMACFYARYHVRDPTVKHTLPSTNGTIFKHTVLVLCCIWRLHRNRGVWLLSLYCLKRKLQCHLFLVSLVTVLEVQGYWMLATQAIALLGTEAIIMPMLVIVTSTLFIFLQQGCKTKQLAFIKL